jgi:hypothetical protein
MTYAPGEPHLLPRLIVRDYPSINREVMDGRTAKWGSDVGAGGALAGDHCGMVGEWTHAAGVLLSEGNPARDLRLVEA